MLNQSHSHIPWNKGKLVGQKALLTQQQVWPLRIRLEAAGNPRNLALFNLAIDSRLRACDLLSLRAVQLLLVHTKLDSTVRYLGIKIDDALEMSEQIDV